MAAARACHQSHRSGCQVLLPASCASVSCLLPRLVSVGRTYVCSCQVVPLASSSSLYPASQPLASSKGQHGGLGGGHHVRAARVMDDAQRVLFAARTWRRRCSSPTSMPAAHSALALRPLAVVLRPLAVVGSARGWIVVTSERLFYLRCSVDLRGCFICGVALIREVVLFAV